ncbi:ester cyclase [Nocardia sp. KC 131]|uniref:ester cyclase n=1 Tax=Nocardia arseniciresistens TaxID=3392119 RepID=UPI00398F6409
MSTEDNKALVHRFEEEVWNGRDPSQVEKFFTADHVFRAAGSPPLDREGHREMIAEFQRAFPDGRTTSEDLLAEGDKVAQRWSYHGTHRGAFQGIMPTGREVTLTGISIWRFDGDKIVESWHEINTLGLMQQLGVTPAPSQDATTTV